jgi:hypothetical protein
LTCEIPRGINPEDGTEDGIDERIRMENGTSVPTVPTAPYVSYVTFRNFLERLSKHLPTRIDNSVMQGISGSARSQLMIALRFLSLVGNGGEPTQRLKDLASAWGDEKQWPDTLTDVVCDAYSNVIGQVDLDHATAAELLEAFRERGGGGASVAEKAVRFYLKSLDDSKQTYSPHFKARRKSSRRPGGQRQRDAGDPGGGLNRREEQDQQREETPAGFLVIPIPFHNKKPGKIFVPDNLEVNDISMVDAAVAMLKVWAAGKSNGKKSTSA